MKVIFLAIDGVLNHWDYLRTDECLTSEHEEDWQEQVVSNWKDLRASLFDKIGRFFQRRV